MKDKALKDVTNKLEPKPAKLKPSWAGVKSTNRLGSREVGFVNKLVSHGPNESPATDGMKGMIEVTGKGGITLQAS